MYSCLECELFEHLFFLVQDFSLLVVSRPAGLHLGGGGVVFFEMGQVSVVLSVQDQNSFQEMSLGKAASGIVEVCKSQVCAILPANTNIDDADLHRY